MSEHLYPRPQLMRPNWVNLNGSWKFAFDNERKYEVGSVDWSHDIMVPFAPETKASGIGDTGFHKYCWYEREFNILPSDERVILHFGAVDYYARVWVNDCFVIEHTGGHTPFSVDITHVLKEHGVQKITLFVEDDPNDLAKPRGKQDWKLEPHSIWYPRTTGIWQTVWVEKVPKTYISKIRWSSNFDNFEIGCEVFIDGDIMENLTVQIKIHHEETLLAEDRYKIVGSETFRKIGLADPGIDDFRNELLWSPESPTLLDAEITILQNNTVIDTVSSYTALRSVSINRDRFMLNGKPYHLRMVLDQGYWPDSFMTAPNDAAFVKDIELAKAMGFNGVRKHQKIEDPRFLYWADKLGLMVWEEMPSAYRFTPLSINRLVKEWMEVIDRDYSHPCIIVWVPFNESWGVPNLTSQQAHRNAVESMYHLTRTLDQTRPVIGNDGWEASATDILGIHDYDLDPERLRMRYSEKIDDLFDRRRPGGRILTLDGYPHKGQPIILTEFGGIAFGKPEDNEKIWGYGKVFDAEDLLKQYRDILSVINNAQIFSGFCYTQFTDTFQEANGLLYADRTPKIPLESIKKATMNLYK